MQSWLYFSSHSALPKFFVFLFFFVLGVGELCFGLLPSNKFEKRSNASPFPAASLMCPRSPPFSKTQIQSNPDCGNFFKRFTSSLETPCLCASHLMTGPGSSLPPLSIFSSDTCPLIRTISPLVGFFFGNRRVLNFLPFPFPGSRHFPHFTFHP